MQADHYYNIVLSQAKKKIEISLLFKEFLLPTKNNLYYNLILSEFTLNFLWIEDFCKASRASEENLLNLKMMSLGFLLPTKNNMHYNLILSARPKSP